MGCMQRACRARWTRWTCSGSLDTLHVQGACSTASSSCRQLPWSASPAAATARAAALLGAPAAADASGSAATCFASINSTNLSAGAAATTIATAATTQITPPSNSSVSGIGEEGQVEPQQRMHRSLLTCYHLWIISTGSNCSSSSSRALASR
jgi:hypothetical protein